MSLRSRFHRMTSAEEAAIGRLEDAFGSLTIIDNSDGPHLSAEAAADMLRDDASPDRVYLLAAQIRSRRERRRFMRHATNRHREAS